LDRRNLWLGLIAIVLGAAVIVWSDELSWAPAFFPRVVSITLIVLGAYAAGHQAYLLAADARKRGTVFREVHEGSEGNGSDGWKRELRLLPPLAIAVVYVYFFRKLGFAWLTPPLIVLTAWFLGYRRLWISILVAFGFSAVLYFAFRFLLNVPIPASPLLRI
jgi:hypothetical protein